MSTNFRCGLGAVLFIASCQLAAVGQGPSERPRELPLSSSPSVVQPTENWNDLLRQYGTADDAKKSALDKEVREIATSLADGAAKALAAGNDTEAVANFREVIGLCNAMLRSGFPQPWMYEALALAMKACDYPKEDIERVMLSSLDFEDSTVSAVEIANYFAANQMKREALSLLRDTSIRDPQSYDVLALALPLARELDDLEALRWTCVGVLSKAWPPRYDRLAEEARLAARATSFRLKQSGRILEATAFENAIKDALRRDIVVRVTWTGDAELALRVKEPVGTICSFTHPQTISGGVLLSESSAKRSKDSINGKSEYYVCPQGYAGEYDILVRRIFGKVSGGKATVEVLTDYGTPDQRSIVQQVEINERDSLLRVAVKNGHRQQPMAATDLAHIDQQRRATGISVLAQMAAADASSSSGSPSTGGTYATNPYAAMQALLAAGAANNGFPFRGAVGYRPVIQTIPEGARMFATGVVSADRRYVRVAPFPFFSQIGEVFTFNFVSGTTAGGTGTTGGTGAGNNTGGGFGNGGGGGVF